MKREDRTRLDVLLVARGLAPTREKAQALILAGLVEVDGRRAEKAGEAFGGGRGRSSVAGRRTRTSRAGASSSRRPSTRFGIDPAGQGLPRRGRVDRGLHGLPAAARRGARLRGGRRATASSTRSCAPTRACVVARAGQRALALRGRRPGAGRSGRGRRLVHLAAAHSPRRRSRWREARRHRGSSWSSRSSKPAASEVPRGGVVRSEQTRRRVVEEIEALGRELRLDRSSVRSSRRSGARAATTSFCSDFV